jgi:hypothetical protein
VAELGPGDSVGVGIAALLSGAQEFTAFDVAPYIENTLNLRLVDELSGFFRGRRANPNSDGWPSLLPYLDAAGFPSHILTDALLEQTLRPERIEAIRGALQGRRPASACSMLPHGTNKFPERTEGRSISSIHIRSWSTWMTSPARTTRSGITCSLAG